MKSKRLSTYISIVFLSIGLYGCSEYEGLSGNGGKNLKKGRIEMKVQQGSSKQIELAATANKITINWGDGYIDTYTPNGAHIDITHEYANQNLYTVSIESEKLTEFAMWTGFFREVRLGEMPDLTWLLCGRRLTVLEIKKANALTELQCIDGELESLDVSNCPALKELYCGGNCLLAAALNSLFKSLPNRPAKDGKIDIGGNEGSGGCNPEIAKNKGWSISYRGY